MQESVNKMASLIVRDFKKCYPFYFKYPVA